MIERRSVLKCLAGLIAAPAIVPITNLMKVAPTRRLLTLDDYWAQISLRRIDMERVNQAYEQFGADGYKIGSQLRIRLPNDFTITDGPALSIMEPSGETRLVYIKSRRTIERQPVVPDKLAIAAAAVAAAPAVLKIPVTRRFWALSQHSAAIKED